MRFFTDQQVRFLQEIGDKPFTIHTSFASGDRYVTHDGRNIGGRGITSTFIALRNRGAVARRADGSGHFEITESGRAQLAEQLAMPICPSEFCGRRVGTQASVDGDLSRRFYRKHKDRYGLWCGMTRLRVEEALSRANACAECADEGGSAPCPNCDSAQKVGA